MAAVDGAAVPLTRSRIEGIRAAGFKVALTGDGADEIFGGYRHALDAVAAGDGNWWMTYLNGLIATPRELRHTLYTRDYRRAVLARASVEEQYLQPPSNGRDVLGKLLEFEMANKFPVYHLQRVDHLSMAHSVEARLPFCQRDVIDAGRAIPQSEEIQGNRGKAPLYRIGVGKVPPRVLDRQKQPFTLPLAAMMYHIPELADFAEVVLTDPSVQRDGLLDRTEASRLISRCRERMNGVGAQAIWTLLVYQLWRESVR
jgi:asparagine synthase (glutamine-hydrolysing)